MPFKTICGAVLCLLPLVAHAALDCVVPTREEGFEAERPGARALQRVARAAAEITQRNAVFMAGNQPVRVRTSISYYGLDWLSASVITTAYNRKAWLASGCGVNQFADRGGGLADGRIAIYVNDPGALLGGRLGDAELVASFAPTPEGSLAGFPIFAAGGNELDPRVLLSRAGYRPWVPVTVGEMLDWRERELRAREDDLARSLNREGEALDEAKIEKIYRDMKAVDPKLAEKTRAQMLASLPELRARAASQSAAATEATTRQRAAFDAYRASLTVQRLRAPGTISSATTRDGVSRVDDPSGKPLARIDPAFAKREPGRAHVIVVSVAPQPKTDPEYAWQQASFEALDYSALSSLLGD